MSATSSDWVLRPQDPPGATLDRLAAFAGTGASPVGADVTVTGVSQSSATVRPGDLFAALPGAHQHGVRFVPAALAAGAVAVLTDPVGGRDLLPGLPRIVCADPRLALGPVSAEVYGHPARSMEVVGITGTSGKTTTAFLIRAGLRAAGRSTGLLGTVGTFLGDEQLAGGLTTPEAPELQATLAVLAQRGATCVVMEVSSHALTLNRVEGTEFAVAAFTNLSRDHLDFHPDMERYFEAKARLFDGRARRHVVVVDDEWGRVLADRLGPPAITVATLDRGHLDRGTLDRGDLNRGSADRRTAHRLSAGAGTGAGAGAGWTATDVRTATGGSTTFTLNPPAGASPVAAGCGIPGRYNVANAVLAVAVLSELGVPLGVSVPAVAAAQVPGRMERIEAGQDFTAVVDYAHKPAAVEAALDALRIITAGRLIVVLGCGGDRDREKRPIMGAVAARGADLLIISDDNPRSEEPAAIRAAMRAGATSVPVAERAEIEEIGDRGAAIGAAVRAAGPGDTVLIAGKGHETGQDAAGVVRPFDDRVVLRQALAAARAPQ